MSLQITKTLYGAEIPSTATVYELFVMRNDRTKDGVPDGHTYSAKIGLRFFSEKTKEEIIEAKQEVIVPEISQAIIDLLLPEIYGAAKKSVGGEDI